MTALTTTTRYLGSDSENVLTPRRAAILRNRAAAEGRIKARREALALALSTGVRDASDPGHVIADARRDGWIGGVLFADGTVHLFDRSARQHDEYVADIGAPEVKAGCSRGDGGWGFYLEAHDGQRLRPYMVPQEKVARLEAVVAELLKRVPGDHLPEPWTCIGCGWDQPRTSQRCEDGCGITREESDRRRAAIAPRGVTVQCPDCGERGGFGPNGQACACERDTGRAPTQVARVARTVAADTDLAARRSAAARKAWETRRRKAAAKREVWS